MILVMQQRYIKLAFLQYITLVHITLHYTTLKYITLHYITLHYSTIHHFTLHYIKSVDTNHLPEETFDDEVFFSTELQFTDQVEHV